MATAERIADQMIAMGHSDNATIAQWKEGLKETWQDLLELIETRTQVSCYSNSFKLQLLWSYTVRKRDDVKNSQCARFLKFDIGYLTPIFET